MVCEYTPIPADRPAIEFATHLTREHPRIVVVAVQVKALAQHPIPAQFLPPLRLRIENVPSPLPGRPAPGRGEGQEQPFPALGERGDVEHVA